MHCNLKGVFALNVKTNLFDSSPLRKIVLEKKQFSILEYERDASVSPDIAQTAYFASEMNVRKKQLIIQLSDEAGVYVQAGEMQLMIGEVESVTGVKGVGDFLKKAVGSIVTDETIVKPHYIGNGMIVLEPTFRHIILEDMSEWPDGIVIEDGMFLACEDSIEMELSGRKTVSSLVFGKEGIFNSVLYGKGILALESPVPRDELIEVELVDNILKIDGNMAVAWSPNLKFTVQKSMETLVGSAVSKEGLVNVYEGTGKVLIAPVRSNKGINIPENNQR